MKVKYDEKKRQKDPSILGNHTKVVFVFFT